MKLTLSLLLAAAVLSAEAVKKIEIVVTYASGATAKAKITGQAAAAGGDSLQQWMATQTVCAGTPQVCTPKFANEAEVGKSAYISILESIVDKFPSAATKADSDEIETKKAALAAKRKALFDAAKGEQ